MVSPREAIIRNGLPTAGDIELAAYLTNVVVPMSLVLDLLITHDRFGSSSDPSLNLFYVWC